MSFILKKPHTTGSIAFSPIFCAPGALGFFREGYPWHRVAKLLGMTFEGTSFVAKTATLHPLVGNMPLKKDGLTPKEIKPKCIEVYPRSGHVLNAVGLSNMGFWKMFFDGRWQAMREPFMLSFMPKGNTVEEKVAECQGLVHDFLYQYYQRPYGRFSADFAWQVNFACPNTGTDPACFIAEVPDVLKAFQPLRLAGIPIVANFNALVPLKALLDAEDLCDAYWIANTIPWGTPGIDWTKFTSVFEDGKPVSPLRGRGIPADGGLSGPDCLHFTLAKLEETVKAKVRLPIIAGNGLQEPDQVNLLRAAGASAIAIGSVALVRPWRTGAIIARAHEVFGNQAGSKREIPLGGKISGAANQFPSYWLGGTMTQITPIIIHTAFDGHVHLRDGEALRTTVPHIASRFGNGIVMPNLKPAVKTVAEALAYRERILSYVPSGSPFDPLMTLYLTETTGSDELLELAGSEGKVVACKLYPAGATTNSSEGIPDVEKAYGIFEAMERLDIVLCIHGEVTDPSVDVFDKEAVFIDRYLRKIRETFPNLRIVLEHITTKDGVEFVESAGPNTAASITAHHLLFNRNAIFQGGLQPHFYCLPILKRDVHQEVLIRAATGGMGNFFAGTDSAPHPKNLKETSCGCAGCYTAPQSVEMYAEVFDRAGAFDPGQGGVGIGNFEWFMSKTGPTFYRIPVSEGYVTLRKETSEVPPDYPFGESGVVVPLLAGKTIEWKAERILRGGN